MQEANEPDCLGADGAVNLVIRPQEKDLGAFSVRRVLPSSERRMVGPFVFYDHMGPAEFPPGKGIEVRPHPHIGIATITYLFEGEIMHRDSLGYELPIRPGAVNLMTAGRGIVHSERAGSDLHETSYLHGIQSWIALPDTLEEAAPAFEHTPAEQLPEFEERGVSLRVIMGEFKGHRSPVTTHSKTLYLDASMEPDALLQIPAGDGEAAVYVVAGSVLVDGDSYGDRVMLVARPGAGLTLEAVEPTRLMVIGGDAVGERHLWWNFVSSSRARIEQAKDDWRSGRFGTVAGDDEFIPLPE